MSRQGDGLDDAPGLAEREAELASAVMTAVLVDRKEREAVLGWLKDSADQVDAVAPEAWAVTLFENGFRFNVGRVEAVVLNGATVRVNLLGELSAMPVSEHWLVRTAYRSMPAPQCAFVGPADAFSFVREHLSEAHSRFLQRAARTSAGRPVRGTVHRRSHCEGLMVYARRASLGATGEPTGDRVWTYQGEEVEEGSLLEGAPARVVVNRFERSRAGRLRCIAAHGAACVVCGFDFGVAYGEAMHRYITVHHLMPLSVRRAEYVLNPEEDMRPVCPNCHAVIHSRVPEYSLDEVRAMLGSQHLDGERREEIEEGET